MKTDEIVSLRDLSVRVRRRAETFASREFGLGQIPAGEMESFSRQIVDQEIRVTYAHMVTSHTFDVGMLEHLIEAAFGSLVNRFDDNERVLVVLGAGPAGIRLHNIVPVHGSLL